VEVYARIRRAVQVDGMSIRQAAREFGLSRKSIRKMLQFSLPPGYERKKPVARPRLGPWLGIIDQILVDDQSQPRKQRHTCNLIDPRSIENIDVLACVLSPIARPNESFRSHTI
jgi:helix-turn-helix, Psq domain